jgi:hypothetical protein
MPIAKYLISLTKDEEIVAQLLRRDAWTFFNDPGMLRELSLLKQIPLIPRRGTFAITADEDLIQYFLDYAQGYEEELSGLGWESARIERAGDGFARKLEDISGQLRASSLARERLAG